MSPAATSTDLVVSSTQELTEMFAGTDLAPLWSRARLYASGNMLQKDLRGRPADAMAIMMTCLELDVPPTPLNIKHFWIGPDGTPEPDAQLTIGLATAAGYETKWGRNDDELAQLMIRREGDDEWQTFSFSIEQAKRAHMLDEWAEHWANTQDGKRFKQTYVTLCQSPTPCKASLGPRPSWVDKGDRVEFKRHENYFSWPADMLCARVAVRAVKRAAPEVRLGMVGHIRAVADGPAGRGHVVLAPPADDDDIFDAEVLADSEVPGGEPFDEVSVNRTSDKAENNIPAKVTPEDPVPAAKAKLELVAAAKEQGLDELSAKAVAQQAWALYRLNGDAVSRAALSVVLAEVRIKASAAAAGETHLPAAAGEAPAAASPPTNSEQHAAAGDAETLFGGEAQ